MTLDGEDDRVMAAEYALRLLRGDDRDIAARRAAAEPDFAAEVRFWEARFVTLHEETPDVPPSAAAKRALMARLFGETRRQPWYARASLWAGATVAAAATAAFLALALFEARQVPTLYTTELASADGSLRVLAVYDSVSGHIRLTRTEGTAAEGRDLQLWGIAAGNAPISVGVLPDDAARSGFDVPAELRDALPSLTLAISDEPDGGSPTGQPTGDVLAVGEISEI